MRLRNVLFGVSAAAGIGALVLQFSRRNRNGQGIPGREFLRRITGKRGTQEVQRDTVELNSEQSFPASDPPSWTVG